MGQIDKNLKNELFKVAIDYIYKEHLVGSQGELAEKIGISASALSRIMNDKKFVGDDTLRKMNEAFGNIFNMAYFRGEDPHCMLIEDLAYYKQHPEKRLMFDKSHVSPTPTIPAEPAPQAIDYTFLIEKAVEKATAYADKMIATLEKQVAILEKDVETKDREISILKARLHEFEIATTIITPGQKYPFEVGVSEAKDQPSAKI
jgi:transcriptional regulator with XRE-family HTH domain